MGWGIRIKEFKYIGVILPVQLFTQRMRLSKEQALLCNLIVDAIVCVFRVINEEEDLCLVRRPADVSQAISDIVWFCSDDDYPLSFRYCCDHLPEVDYSTVKKKMRPYGQHIDAHLDLKAWDYRVQRAWSQARKREGIGPDGAARNFSEETRWIRNSKIRFPGIWKHRSHQNSGSEHVDAEPFRVLDPVRLHLR